MPSHIHLIIRAKEGNPEIILGKLKEHTSKHLQKLIRDKPIELWTPEVTEQKLDYIHNNPVISGFVHEPEQ